MGRSDYGTGRGRENGDPWWQGGSHVARPGLLATRLVSQAQRLAVVQGGEHAGDDIGLIELLTKTRGAIKLGGGVEATVEVPANEVLTSH